MQQFVSDAYNNDGGDGGGGTGFTIDIMKYWLRFGLPIGSAFVTAVLLDNIIAFDSLLKEIILAPSDKVEKDEVESYNYQADQNPLLYVFVRSILSIALWGILTKKPQTFFFIWIIAAVIFDLLKHGNPKVIFNALFSSFDVYLFILMPLIRVYLYVIFIEVARIIEKQKEPRLLVGSYDGADEDLESLVPIGYDVIGIYKYYDRFHVLGTRMLCTVDLVWIIVALPAIKGALGGFAGFLLIIIGVGLAGYAITAILQKTPHRVVLWRLLFLMYTVLVAIAFLLEFNQTRKEPSEQGVISTLTLCFLLLYKIFVIYFSLGIESSMQTVDLSGTNANNQIAQIEGISPIPEEGYQVTEGDWSSSAPPLTPLSGRVIITELERSGRTSRASRLTWGSQPGGLHQPPGLGGSREGITSSLSGWGGSESIVSSGRMGELDSQSQSARTSREAISTVSSISGWTTASAQDSQSDIR